MKNYPYRISCLEKGGSYFISQFSNRDIFLRELERLCDTLRECTGRWLLVKVNNSQFRYFASVEDGQTVINCLDVTSENKPTWTVKRVGGKVTWIPLH